MRNPKMALNQESMTPATSAIKALTVRWPDKFWEAVATEAVRRRTSIQALITEAVSEKLGIPIDQPESDDAG